MSPSSIHHLEHSDPAVLLEVISSLPGNHRIQIPVNIVSVSRFGGIQAHFSNIPLCLHDLTSMGLSQHANIRPNICVWLEGFWGETLSLPKASPQPPAPSLSVVSVGELVDRDAPLSVRSLSGPITLPT